MTEKQTKPLEHLMFKGHLGITFRVIGITLLTLLVFAGGGHLLDQKFGTSPVLMVVGLIVSFPLNQLIIYRVFRSLTDSLSKK